MPQRVVSQGHLHAVVDAIAAAGSAALARRAADGAAVPFDLVEMRGPGGASMMRYQPRTLDFVEQHVDALRQLPAWPAAVNVLAGFDHLGDYLLSHGLRSVPPDARDRADLVLRVLLAEMHAETGDFQHTPGRARAAADELARCVHGGRVESVVVVPLLGVRLAVGRLVVDEDLMLLRDDALQDLPGDARSPVRGRPGTLAVVNVLEDPTGAAGLALARPRLRMLLSALRLYDAPSPALAPVAWTRTRGGGWSSHPFVGTCARATGLLELGEQHVEAIRGFITLLGSGQRLTGHAAWAQRRFELACERSDHTEALTDVLLGLRALLGAHGPGHTGTLAERLAALCARPNEEAELIAEVERALDVEQAAMRGETVDPVELRRLVIHLRGHLRALLRDVACGHLPSGLDAVAERHLGRPGGGAPTDDAPDDGASGTTASAAPASHAAGTTASAPTTAEHPAALEPTGREASSQIAPGDAGNATGIDAETQAAFEADLGDLLELDAMPAGGAVETSADERERTESGERFETAFLRSLHEGPAPSAAAAPGAPAGGLFRRRRGGRRRPS